VILKTKSLVLPLLKIIQEKATEKPFTGEYDDSDEPGTYLCRQCGLALFRAQHKFHSGCGWPSFDHEMPNAVVRKPDDDGHRIEILCQRCQAHLGHVFLWERLTPLNVRHCVNSASLDFTSNLSVEDSEEAIFAAGCFWGVEYYFKKLEGVIKTEVGYTGGHQDYPSYESVCAHHTGHFEAIRVVYDPKKIDFEAVTRYFFEIHDPTQADGQGPDLGEQYLSVIFYYNDSQKAIAHALKEQLEKNNYSVSTQILPVKPFWRAENYHQNYDEKMQKKPYCHRYTKRF
jgi:peptide methionine sulfoxide reductase msrA/msrB